MTAVDGPCSCGLIAALSDDEDRPEGPDGTTFCPCAGQCHHDTHPCSLGCWAAQKPWRAEEAALRSTRSEDEPGTLDARLLGLLERGKTLEARDLLRRRVGHLPSLDATRRLSDPTASEASDAGPR